MIIFFLKKTGEIIGTIDGRIHTEAQLKMWIGNRDDTDRLIVEYKKVNERTEVYEEPIFEEFIDEDGFTESHQVGKKKKKRIVFDFEPEHKQKDLFSLLDKQTTKIYEYKVDLKTKDLIRKNE